jgi:hypothetical protein
MSPLLLLSTCFLLLLVDMLQLPACVLLLPVGMLLPACVML